MSFQGSRRVRTVVPPLSGSCLVPEAAMGSRLLCCVALCLLGTVPLESEVIQTPKHLIKARRQPVTLNCSYESGHYALYWYQQTQAQGLQFLVQYYNGQLNEKGILPANFSVQQFSNDHRSELTVSSLEPEDSALYLCASSIMVRGGYTGQLYFGAGSRLTVLDNLNKVRLPNVAIFEPSEAEINHTQKATLVCLARDFYPDHVELTWWVNGKEVHSGVITDPEPYQKDPSQKDSSYYLSSRLRVSAAFWHNARNHFRCQVQFYGISEDDTWEDARRPKPVTQNISAGLWGRADCGMTSVSYQQGIMSATLLYEVLLGKAILYAVLVSGLVLIGVIKTKNS